MGMRDPIPTFTYLVRQLRTLYPDFAYLHVVEPRVAGDETATDASGAAASVQSNDFLRTLWAPRPFISAGNYTRDTALSAAEERDDIVAFGRRFIANVSCPPLRL